MTAVVFHGSPRKGNTYFATSLFMEELAKCGDVRFAEFFLPGALPAFCTGCTICFKGQTEKCPNTHYVAPILDAIIKADALIFATPHYGACSMPASMKNLLDHLDFLVLNVAPREKIFSKKAFILTTGAGSTAAIRPIKSALMRWGVNHVGTLGIRIFSDKWSNMPAKKQAKHEKALRRCARKFYRTKKRRPHFSTVLHYHLTKFILRRYVGKGNFPYDNWEEKGYFNKRPF